MACKTFSSVKFVYCAAVVPREIFGVNALIGKLHQPGSPNLQDIFIRRQVSQGLKLASFRKTRWLSWAFL